MRAWLENKIIRIVLFTALAARITAALFAGTAPVQDRPASGPEHVILIIVDGLSYKVWDKMELPALRKLASGDSWPKRSICRRRPIPVRGRTRVSTRVPSPTR